MNGFRKINILFYVGFVSTGWMINSVIVLPKFMSFINTSGQFQYFLGSHEKVWGKLPGQDCHICK